MNVHRVRAAVGEGKEGTEMMSLGFEHLRTAPLKMGRVKATVN